MREKVIEQKLVAEVKRRGGICPKWVSQDLMGCPTGLSCCRVGTSDWWRSKLRVNVRDRCRFHGTGF